MIRLVRLALITAVGLVSAATAFAQSGPSFDCAKASNDVERTICKDPELAKADREMAAAYATVAAKLSGAAKENLEKEQVRWLGDRNRGCAADTDGIDPFISEQSLSKNAKLGKITYSYDISYPKFEGTTADFAAVNARFANAAKKAIADATPQADSGLDREQGWTYEQGFTIYRPGANAVTVAVNFYGYSGGAHGFGATTCTLVDLRTGKIEGPGGVFAAGDKWLKTMVEIVGADLKKQFVDKPGFEEALEPASLAKLLREPGHYCWHANRL